MIMMIMYVYNHPKNFDKPQKLLNENNEGTILCCNASFRKDLVKSNVYIKFHLHYCSNIGFDFPNLGFKF